MALVTYFEKKVNFDDQSNEIFFLTLAKHLATKSYLQKVKKFYEE